MVEIYHLYLVPYSTVNFTNIIIQELQANLAWYELWSIKIQHVRPNLTRGGQMQAYVSSAKEV